MAVCFVENLSELSDFSNIPFFHDTTELFGLYLSQVLVRGDGYVARSDDTRSDFEIYPCLALAISWLFHLDGGLRIEAYRRRESFW